MTRRLLFFTLLLAIAGGAHAQTDPQAFVRRTHLDTGEQYDFPPIDTSGSQSFSENEVRLDGALFELWATDVWGRNLMIVDQKTVNAYAPEATIEFTSEDSYSRGDLKTLSYVQRTRADRPFFVTIQLEGFVYLDDNQMLYTVDRTRFSPLTYAPDPSQPIVASDAPRELITNINEDLEPEFQSISLSGEDPLYACGRQTYTMRWTDPVFASVGGGIDLVKAAIEIWPMTKVELVGIEEGKMYVDRLPLTTLRLEHLYPDSRTYLRIYQGTQNLDAVGTVIDGTESRKGSFYDHGAADPTVPQSYTPVDLVDLSKYTPTDGTWTLEVITHTPFFRDGESLFHVTFQVDRIISTRGQLSVREPTTPPDP